MSSIRGNTAGQSLFIVDRDWLRQGSKARKSWTGNVRNRSLYGLAIEVSDHQATQRPTRTKTKLKAKRRRLERSEEIVQFQDDSSESGKYATSMLSSCGSSPTSWSDTDQGVLQNTPCTIPITDCFHAQSQSVNQRSSSRPPSYDSIKGLECYLDYYLDVIGTAQHPLEARSLQSTETPQSERFPLAFEDDLWLQNVALFATLQNTSRRKATAPATVDALMYSFLSQLNDRISKSDLSDSTIASVSCLMLGEHIKGNDQLARVHAAGMAEMIRLRGGLGTIQRARRGKIARADLVRSVDALEPPMLPRLTRDSIPLGLDVSSPPDHYREKLSALHKSGVSPELISILRTLGSVCERMEAAWMGYTILDAVSFHESILCINHDLLSFTPRTGLDEILKISIINFTQPMFRQCSFSEQRCRIRVQRLRSLLEEHDTSVCDENIILWIMFVAYITSQEVVSERDWFKTNLLASFEKLSIPKPSSWVEVRCQLQDFLWTESVHDPIGHQLYDSLESKRISSLSGLEDAYMHCIDPSIL